MLDANAVKAWDGIHRWTSLVCTLFLLVVCLTGLPLIFKDEIKIFLRTDTSPSTAGTSTRHASLDQVTEMAMSRYPGQVPLSFYWDEHATGIVRFSVAKEPNLPWTEVQWIAIDSRSAQVVENVPSSPLVMSIFLKLHKELLAGVAGEIFLGVMGLMFLGSLVSGIILYGPFMRKLAFGSVRHDRSHGSNGLIFTICSASQPRHGR